jgi:hypothetical protein
VVKWLSGRIGGDDFEEFDGGLFVAENRAEPAVQGGGGGEVKKFDEGAGGVEFKIKMWLDAAEDFVVDEDSAQGSGLGEDLGLDGLGEEGEVEADGAQFDQGALWAGGEDDAATIVSFRGLRPLNSKLDGVPVETLEDFSHVVMVDEEMAEGFGDLIVGDDSVVGRVDGGAACEEIDERQVGVAGEPLREGGGGGCGAWRGHV